MSRLSGGSSAYSGWIGQTWWFSAIWPRPWKDLSSSSCVVHAGRHRLAQLEIVEGRLGDPEPHDRSLRRRHRVDVHKGQRRHRLVGITGQAVDHVHLLRGKRRDPGIGVLTMVIIVDLVQVEGAGPPVPRPPEDGSLAHVVPDQLERSGCRSGCWRDRRRSPRRSPMHDGSRVVVELLRHGQIRLLQVELDGVVVDHLDSVGDAPLHAFRIGLDHGTEEPQVRRADSRVEPAAHRVGDIGGSEGVAVRPSDALAQMEDPGREVVGSLPLLGEVGDRDVVRPGSAQMLHYEAGYVRPFDPVENGRVVHRLHPLGDLEHAASLGRLFGLGGADHVTARHAGHGIGRAGSHAEQCRMAQELAPVDLACLQLIAELGQVGMRIGAQRALRRQRVAPRVTA